MRHQSLIPPLSPHSSHIPCLIVRRDHDRLWASELLCTMRNTTNTAASIQSISSLPCSWHQPLIAWVGFGTSESVRRVSIALMGLVRSRVCLACALADKRAECICGTTCHTQRMCYTSFSTYAIPLPSCVCCTLLLAATSSCHMPLSRLWG